MNQVLTLLLLAMITTTFCYGQKVVNTAGKSITNQGVYLDYSIGEISIATLSSNGNIITQGALQPNYKVLTSVNDVFDALFSFKTYPNPVTAQLTIETDYPGFEDIRILNINGQIIYQGAFDYKPIDASDLPIGTYFIHIYSKLYNKTIKIIKQ